MSDWASRDPAGFVAAFSENIPATPAEPAPAPDVLEDPVGYQRWTMEQVASLVKQQVSEIKKEFQAQLAPAADLAKQHAAQLQMAKIKQDVGADDDDWTSMQELAARAAKEPWKLLKEHAELKRQLAGKAKKVQKAVAGMEEKPGLPKRGARVRRPVRDPENAALMKSLDDDGFVFPD